MDDYMREMVDLKTLVTKTLEKKGVLARIRAELRANVFQAMEEQDHEAESNGSSTFSLLGTCNERAKKLHSSHSGKLLMALVCEYMEWCELEHTMKVYMPELNQPRAYNRAELEDILGLDGESKRENPDSGPLLLTLVESFLKDEKKDSSGAGPVGQTKHSRHGAMGGQQQMNSGPSSITDPSETLEARVSMANKKLPEKPMGGSHDTSFQSRSEADSLVGASDGLTSPRPSDENHKLYEKSSSRAQALLADLPQHRRSSGLPAFSGINRGASNARGSSNGLANDQQSAVPGGARDSNNDATQKRREYSWREEDELHSGSFLSKKKESTWRDQEYDNSYANPVQHNTQSYPEKGDGKQQLGEHSTSQTRRGLSMDNTGKALGNLHIEDDSASDLGSRQSSGSRGTPTGQSWQPAPRDISSATTRGGDKKQASAYFYSDSEDEVPPELCPAKVHSSQIDAIPIPEDQSVCCTQTLNLSESDSEEESGREAEIIEGGVLSEGGQSIEGDPMEDKLSVGKGDHGCAHYRRRCKIRAPCCNEIFGCRHCHNEVKNANEKDCEKRHDIPRHDIKKVICLLCDHEQDVKQVCGNCGVCMGDYYCEKCKFFDDETDKQQYHCDSCGICRVGGRDNFFHCDRCASCYTIALQNGHPCVEKSMHQNCPVCFEYLFDSVLSIAILSCGHTMHQQCLREMHQHAHKVSCPMCNNPIYDTTRCWRHVTDI